MLLPRALSALVLAPFALAAVWRGGYSFAALVALATAVMAWEWHRMVAAGRFGGAGRVTAVVVPLACLASVALPLAGVALVAGAALASVALGGRVRVWAGAGAVYVGLPAVALVWLREAGESGRLVMVWLLLLVWATDIGAYAFGRLIGGPLLAPRISPKKTWAGLFGGMLCAGLVGMAVALRARVGDPAALAAASVLLAIIAQGGDFLESWVKRRWGVKDTGAIIPGHGGVLDRVDGLLAAGGAVALATLASGETVFKWL
ncbi:MAG: phosphatidate cytidylyltransferase [Magnetospirillum sp.]|nr:phosphatidate cytidylyltransferase [Magnetospirillum sp.]